MTLLYLIVLLFSVLTVYFIYDEYKKAKFSRNKFILVSILEVVVVITTAILLIKSL